MAAANSDFALRFRVTGASQGATQVDKLTAALERLHIASSKFGGGNSPLRNISRDLNRIGNVNLSGTIGQLRALTSQLGATQRQAQQTSRSVNSTGRGGARKPFVSPFYTNPYAGIGAIARANIAANAPVTRMTTLRKPFALMSAAQQARIAMPMGNFSPIDTPNGPLYSAASNWKARFTNQNRFQSRGGGVPAFTQMRGMFSGLGGAGMAGAASILTGRMNVLSNTFHDIHLKFRGLAEASMALKGTGSQLMMAGAVPVGLGALAANEAGKFELKKKGIGALLDPGSNVDDYVKQIRAFDRRSNVTNFEQSTQSFQGLLGAGMKQNEVIPFLDKLSDAVSGMGGTTENFEAAVTQFRQAQAGAKFNQRDVNALSTSAGLPILEILRAGLGDERIKRFNEGETLTGEEAIKGFNEGVYKYKGGAFKGASERGVESLPGQISNLTSALQQLAIAVGEALLPVVTSAVRWITKIADAFTAAIEGPFGWFWKSLTVGVIVLGAAAIAIGAVIYAVGTMVGAWGGVMNVLGYLGITSIPKFGAALLSVATYLLPVIEALLAYVWVSGLVTDAVKMSNEELEKAHPIINHWWKAWGAIFDWFGDKLDWLRGKLHLGGQHSFDEQNIKENYEADKKLAEKRGQVMEDYDTYRAKFIAQDEKAAADEGRQDKNATYGRTAADKELNAKNATIGGGGTLANINTAIKEATAALAKLNINSNIELSATPGATGYSESDEYAAMMGDKGAKQKVKEGKFFDRILKRRKLGEKAEKSAELQQRIEAIGGDSVVAGDVGNIDALQTRLRAVNRLAKDKDAEVADAAKLEAETLKERIALANDEKARLTKQGQEQKTLQRFNQKVQDELHKERMDGLREQLKKLSGPAKETLQKQIKREETNWRRGKLGMAPLSALAEAAAKDAKHWFRGPREQQMTQAQIQKASNRNYGLTSSLMQPWVPKANKVSYADIAAANGTRLARDGGFGEFGAPLGKPFYMSSAKLFGSGNGMDRINAITADGGRRTQGLTADSRSRMAALTAESRDRTASIRAAFKGTFNEDGTQFTIKILPTEVKVPVPPSPMQGMPARLMGRG